MIKAPDDLQDLRRKIYAKAKAEAHWRFWGLYVHVCKRETLRAAYAMAKSNDGAPGSDGVTFEVIEEQGVESFLEQIRGGLIEGSYVPLRARKKEIAKEGSTKVRTLSIPCIRDRVVQGALKLIVEPIFEADFQPGSFGYRPKRSAQQAALRVADAIATGKTHVIDLDLKAYFDGVRHDVLLAKVARRISDPDVLHLFKIILKANGKRGVPQGGVISPVLSNLYLNEVDQMLERARERTRLGKLTAVAYARYADDLVILIHADSGRVPRAPTTRSDNAAPSHKTKRSAVDTRQRRLIRHYLLGEALFAARRYEEAVTTLTEVISLEPDYKDTYGERGLLILRAR